MHEVSRLSPSRAGTVLAAIYALLAALMSALCIPVILMVPPTDPAGHPYSTATLVEVLLAYPVVAAVMGWLSGVIGSLAYNLAANRLGGLTFDVGVVGRASGGAPLTKG